MTFWPPKYQEIGQKPASGRGLQGTPYGNFTPKLDKGTVKIVNEEGFSELQFDLPIQKSLETEPSIVKMMIFLIVGVLIGIIVTICLVFMNQRYCNRHKL